MPHQLIQFSFCDKTRQWSNSGGIKRESSALSSSDVRLVQLSILQVAHKSERNLSSSSRHAYTFHVIGQTVGYHQDGDDHNHGTIHILYTYRDGGQLLCIQKLVTGNHILWNKTNIKPRIFLPHSTPALLLHLQPPVGGELPKLYREEEACVQETSQLKWSACVTSQLKWIAMCSRDITIAVNFFRQEHNKWTPAWHYYQKRVDFG